jgi:hypothetical protein
VALLAKVWSARLALLGRSGTAGILMGFDASDRAVVALHLLRTMRPRARIVVANLREATASPEIEAFMADIRIRWSLDMLRAGPRPEPPAIGTKDEVVRADPDTLRSLIRAARDAGCEAIVYPRQKAATPHSLHHEAAALAAATWIDPASYFTDKDIKSYVEHFYLPVCRSTRTIAAPASIASHPELLERMRGLGYF